MMTESGASGVHLARRAIPPKQNKTPVLLRRAEPAAAAAPPSLYRELLQGLYDAVLISDLDGGVIDSNRRAEEFLGYTGEQLNKLNINGIISGFDAAVLSKIRIHLAGGRFTVLDAHCIRSDRTTFPAEIALSLIHMTPDGNLVFSIRNIERRKRAQDMLRTEHNALQNAAAAIAITDLSGGLESVNPAFLALWGYSSEDDVRGCNIRLFWPDPTEASALLDRLTAGETWIGELTAVKRNGTEMFVQATAAPNRDSNAAPVGMVFSFIDVTGLKRAEEAIRREAEAQMKKARGQQEFSGLLNIIAIPDVIQLVDSTQKSGTLRILDASEQTVGEVAFLSGQIVRMLAGQYSGEAALRHVLTAGGEAFRFEQHVPSERDASITKGTMSLLLEATRVLDEG